MNKPLLMKAALCAALLSSLAGCAPVVVGSAVMGAVATADRRTFGAQTEDRAIALKADVRLAQLVGQAGHVNVNSFNRKVLLTGEVKDEAMKTAVARDVAAIDGVAGIVDELEVAGASNFTARSSDALITTKVLASLVDVQTVSANSFKVVTERGNVYLMGRVTQREGNVAAEVARGVSGVHQVVKIFEYISEEELQQWSAPSQAPKK